MAVPGAAVANEQPGTASSDSNAKGGFQPGGLSDAAASALSALPPDKRTLVEQEFSRMRRYVTSESQRMAQDVELAGYLRGWLKDQEFVDYIAAREAGNTSEFYRRELERSGDAVPETSSDNPKTLGVAPTPEDGGETAEPKNVDPELKALRERLEAMERYQQTQVQQAQAERTQAEVDQFQQEFPDWEQLVPAMKKVDGRLREAGAIREGHQLPLRDLAILAKQDVEAGLATLAEVEGGEQQQSHGESPVAAPSATQQDSANRQDDSPARSPGRVRSITEAFKLAKEQAGLDPDVPVDFVLAE